MNIGSELRDARIARQLSLNDIARETKIAPSLLRSIENNAFDEVPRGVFTRGYLKAYARTVELDPERIVARYRAAFETPPPQLGLDQEPAAVIDHGPLHIGKPDADAGSRHSEILQFAVVLIVAVVYLASLRQVKPTADAALPTPDVAEQQIAAIVPPEDARPVGTSGTLVDRTGPMAIELHPMGPCWVDVTVNGEHALGRLMNAGDREKLTVAGDLTLRVGDPAAFAFSIDGAAGRSLGPEGQPVTVRINRANYRTLLAGQGS